ncbi:MAG TPA: hypothetical protein VEY30_13000 [Myxococcaceae bacterium]|nr:hypothetical protein [Myxococcaceae bacterium]
MKLIRAAIALLSLASFGCGGIDPVPQCDVDGYVFYGLGSITIDCLKAEKNVALARALAAQHGIEGLPSNLAITVRDLDVVGPDGESGRYIFETQEIVLNRSGASLMHELVHAWQARNEVIDPDHSLWEPGLNSADALFKARAFGME